MRQSKKLAGFMATAVVVATLSTASAFADSRHQNETWRGRDYGMHGRGTTYRDNDRVTLEGRVRSLDRDRDGFRVLLDRAGYAFFVPQRALRNRARDFRVGVSVRFGGVFRGGSVYVDDVDFYDGYGSNYGYGRESVRGVVERVDYRRGTVTLRDDDSGRFVTVDMVRSNDRSNRSVDLNDLRRGDFVTISGTWLRNGVFEGFRIDSVQSGRGRY